MDGLGRTAAAVVLASWTLFVVLGLWNHTRVRRGRRRAGVGEHAPALRDPASMAGLLIEGVAFFLVFTLRRTPAVVPAWAAWPAMACGVSAVVLFAAALAHLGLEWRVKAVVTEGHRLVTTGPYAVVRHPIYASLFLLLLASALLFSRWWMLPLATAIYLAGTEIRIHAEDQLLGRRFGERFTAYQARVPAFLPFVR
jgi:protein-S-isoprenylcysteine O-methyltransferase Ste14